MWTYYYYKGQATTYQVSDTGKVRNIKTGRILNGTIDQDGYIKIHITKPENKVLFVHRMVAETYLINDSPEEKKCVNHKDGNKQNNSIGNLEWCTDLYNSHHAWENGLIDTGTHIYCYDKDKNYIGDFISINAAARALDIHRDSIYRSLNNGNPKKCKGYYFLTTKNDNFIEFIPEKRHCDNSSKKKPVVKCDLEGNEIEKYESIKEAAALNHISHRTIADCCHGKIKTGKNFIWKFI